MAANKRSQAALQGWLVSNTGFRGRSYNVPRPLRFCLQTPLLAGHMSDLVTEKAVAERALGGIRRMRCHSDYRKDGGYVPRTHMSESVTLGYFPDLNRVESLVCNPVGKWPHSKTSHIGPLRLPRP